MINPFRSRIHERTISLRFLDIILRVLRLEVQYGFIKPQGGGYGFLSVYPPFSFTVYSNFTVEIVRGCVTVSSKENFFGISSKNLASGGVNQEQKVQFEIFLYML